jgi:hypothetical protein
MAVSRFVTNASSVHPAMVDPAMDAAAQIRFQMSLLHLGDVLQHSEAPGAAPMASPETEETYSRLASAAMRSQIGVPHH